MIVISFFFASFAFAAEVLFVVDYTCLQVRCRFVSILVRHVQAPSSELQLRDAVATVAGRLYTPGIMLLLAITFFP